MAFQGPKTCLSGTPRSDGMRRQGLNPPFETDPGPGASESESQGHSFGHGRAAPPTARKLFRLARIVAGCPRIPVRRFHRLSRYPRPAAFRLPVDGKRCRTHGLPGRGICRGAAGAGTERAAAAIRFAPGPPGACRDSESGANRMRVAAPDGVRSPRRSAP